MDERTARRHLKHMMERELLVQHETKPKLYRLGKYAGKATAIAVPVDDGDLVVA